MKKVKESTAVNVRPWGRYDIIDSGAGFQVKRITVTPGMRLSYQRHARRSEHWTVVSGRGLLTLDGAESERNAGEAVIILVGAKHRIANIGTEPLVFIEVQLGGYLGEDDIERLDDDFGRY